MFCTQCGAQTPEEAKFCAGCGTALKSGTVSPEPGRAFKVETADQPSSAAIDAKVGPTGVGGWLMVLVVGLMVLGPLLGAFRISAEIYLAEHQYPQITTLGEWNTSKSAFWWTFFVFTAVSFYGGLGLAQGKDWSVVSRAKVILWAIGPIASIVMNVVIPVAIFGETEADGKLVSTLIGSVIVAGIWTAYLSKSQRVRNTYGGSGRP